MDCGPPGSSDLQCLPEFSQIHVHLAGDASWPSPPLPPPFLLPSVFPSGRVFSGESALGGQSIGASGFASVLSAHVQSSPPLGLTGLISLQSKGLSRVFSNTMIQKHQFFQTQPSTYWVLPVNSFIWEREKEWHTTVVEMSQDFCWGFL